MHGGVYIINFISQTYNQLTFGAKLYIVFQLAYLLGALFFTYIQVQILRELRKINNATCESPVRVEDNNEKR